MQKPLKCVPLPGKLALRPRRDPTEADADWTIWLRSCLDPPPSVVKAFRRSTNRRELGAALKCGRCRLLLDHSLLVISCAYRLLKECGGTVPEVAAQKRCLLGTCSYTEHWRHLE